MTLIWIWDFSDMSLRMNVVRRFDNTLSHGPWVNAVPVLGTRPPNDRRWPE
jgi:hypothetical protein